MPRVQVNLYADGDIDCFPQGDFPDSDCDIDWNGDGILDPDDLVIDDVNRNGVIDLADVDNYPLGWADPDCVNDPNIPGNECNRGRARTSTATADGRVRLRRRPRRHLDRQLGRQHAHRLPGREQHCQHHRAASADDRCFDGMRNWNQVRPGVFDGGYAFGDYDADALIGGRGTLDPRDSSPSSRPSTRPDRPVGNTDARRSRSSRRPG